MAHHLGYILVFSLVSTSLVSSMEIIKETLIEEFEQEVVKVQPNDLVSAKCMHCICMVESSCNSNIGCRMDVGSLSCGPFQIKEAYWTDCGRPGRDYKTCANNYSCAYGCVQQYMSRYIRFSGCPRNCESYARIHNGGPRGCTRSSTLGYWGRIMNQGCDQNS